MPTQLLSRLELLTFFDIKDFDFLRLWRVLAVPGALSAAGPLVYTARISLGRSSMNIDGRETRLLPGMAVTVEIKTGRRRVLDYLLAPLSQALHDSMRER